jgi:hypothetical protein
VQKLNNEKVLLEQSMEMEEEGIVNRLQRVIESLLARNKAVEACLEAHGLNKDLHPPPIDMSTEWAYSRSPTRADAQARLPSGKAACALSFLLMYAKIVYGVVDDDGVSKFEALCNLLALRWSFKQA